MTIKLNTGKVAFPLEFDNGKKECIYFNPYDPELAVRLIDSKELIQKRIEELSTDDLNSLESLKNDDLKEISELTEEQIDELENTARALSKTVRNVTRIIYEELDRAFGSDISATVFKYCSPFTCINGEYFVLQFLNAITPEIQKYTGNEANSQAMSKHTIKYMRK